MDLLFIEIPKNNWEDLLALASMSLSPQLEPLFVVMFALIVCSSLIRLWQIILGII